MRHLILSATIPALLLAACASTPAEPVYGLAPDMVQGPLAARAPMAPVAAPPHMPTDLTPAGVRAADDHLALEEVNGAEAMAFVLAAALGAAVSRKPEPILQQATA